MKKQCELVGLNRATHYYRPRLPSQEKQSFYESVMAKIDYWHTINPAWGARKLSKTIQQQNSLLVGRKLAKTLMKRMGIASRAPKPNTSMPKKEHKKFPYLLRGKHIWLPNQVWAVDITYIKMGKSHMYLTAIIDWHSRYVVGWTLSYTLDTAPVVQVVEDTIMKYGTPCIINSDQGSQFTSTDYVELLEKHNIRQSMDGKARWIDNVIIERWFRSLKCEEIYINDYASPKELRKGIAQYVNLYNMIRPHESLDNYPPDIAYSCHFQQAS